MNKTNSKNLALKIRRHVINMAHMGKSSHVGSGLSIADILAVLYNSIIKINPKDPYHPNRDRFILSKGHAGAAVYAVLAEMNFFLVEKLDTHYQNGSILSGHVSHKGIPGVELSTGSLGHGLNVGVGLALGAKLDEKDWHTFVLMSDGECDEGSTWEAALFASHHCLNNLIAIVDYNKIQSLGSTKETLDLEPFCDKWRSFNWNVHEVNGHNHKNLYSVFNYILEYPGLKPNVVIANTIKGKGVSFMENKVLWHYRSPQGEEYQKAIQEVESDA